jgi:hypothetical protein
MIAYAFRKSLVSKPKFHNQLISQVLRMNISKEAFRASNAFWIIPYKSLVWNLYLFFRTTSYSGGQKKSLQS